MAQALLFLLALGAGAALTFVAMRQRIQDLRSQQADALRSLDALRSERESHLQELTRLETENGHLQDKLSEWRREGEARQKQLEDSFEVMATRILDARSQNQSQLQEDKLRLLLEPLGQSLRAFKQELGQSHMADQRQRASLLDKIKELEVANREVSKEARTLSQALKGSSQFKAVWGEQMLQRILERAGLRQGRDFDLQFTAQGANDRSYRPDVVIKLPDNRHVIIDAKSSVRSMMLAAEESDPAKQQLLIQQHCKQIHQRLRELSRKEYTRLEGLNSPELLLMFIPSDDAVRLLEQHQPGLQQEAFQHKIVICGPTTLMSSCLAVAAVLQQHLQHVNGLEIAEQAGKMLDKFDVLLKHLGELGQSIQRASRKYDDTIGNLSEGRGNLIGQAEKLHELGARRSKSPASLIPAKTEMHLRTVSSTAP